MKKVVVRNDITSTSSKKRSGWLWWYVLAILLLAGTVNLGMYLPIPTLPSLNGEHWLGFWGGLLGGAIGCIPAIKAIYENREESKKQHEEAVADRVLSVHPVMDIMIRPIGDCPSSFEDYEAYFTYGKTDLCPFTEHVIGKHFNPNLFLKNRERLMCLEISNIGCGPALRCATNLDFGFGSFSAGSRKTYIVFFPKVDANQEEYELIIRYDDIYGNKYMSIVKFSFLDDHNWRIHPTEGPIPL